MKGLKVKLFDLKIHSYVFNLLNRIHYLEMSTSISDSWKAKITKVGFSSLEWCYKWIV